MKNLSLIIQGILIVAVAILMWREFTPVASTEEVVSDSNTPDEKPLKIAYVNADTLLEKYTYFKTKKEALEKRQIEADAALKARGRALEKEVMAVQEKMQKGELSGRQIQEEEQRLGQKQQNLMAEQERAAQSLLEEGQKIQEELQKTILTELKELNTKYQYDFIFSHQTGGQILVATDSLDLTKEILRILNSKSTN